MNKKIVIIISLAIIGLFAGIYSYMENIKVDDASAVTAGTDNPGHSWSTMECSATSLCIVNNNLGIAMGASKNPINNLDVNGSVAIGTSYAGVNTAPTNGLIVQGNVGIGTITTPTQALEVNGTIFASGSGSDVCNSSGICLSQIAALAGKAALIGSAHIESSCTGAGGTLVDIGAAAKLCKFSASSCPSGWNHYQNWGTLGGGCICTSAGNQYCWYEFTGCGPTYTWQNKAPDTYSGGAGSQYQRTYSEIGCY